jgi:hypothetical protein
MIISLKKNGIVFLALLIFFSACSLSWGSTHEDAAVIQKASQAFTNIAKNAIPTVVFIRVEQTVEASAHQHGQADQKPADGSWKGQQGILGRGNTGSIQRAN